MANLAAFQPVNGIVPRVGYQSNTAATASQFLGNTNANSQDATNQAIQRRVAKVASNKAASDAAYMAQLQKSQDAANAALAKKQADSQAAAQAAAQKAAKAQQDAVNKAIAAAKHSGAAPVATNTGGGVPAPAATGHASYAPLGNRGNPDQSGWASSHLVTVHNGAIRYTVNKNAAQAFQGFLHALTNAGYKVSTVQGYNNRGMRSDPSKKSEHAYGDAIDINPGQNPANFQGQLHTNMPPWVSSLAARYGLVWGGNWKNMPDPMHFEYAPGGVSGAGNYIPGYSGAGAYKTPSSPKSASKGAPAFIAKQPPRSIAKPAPKSGGFNFATAGNGR